MNRDRLARAATGIAWSALVVAFVAAAGVWGTTIGGVFAGGHPVVSSTAVPTFTSSSDATLSPNTTYVAEPQTGCLFVKNGTGQTIVMSATTGSVLTAGQVQNCTK